ncbi:hypothetical protein CH302_28340 [Rhodococcus sp. 15-2388-1-1a]|uniref:hypothetical protein n=1 Tax=unclassified Rhodococcus (in: high G+C Gram-positive bacteria) TaxID=192944 RepID=UPI000B9A2406|nr:MULTISPECIES: hypothetical protein [unclassified Rhodococcus (in: high G+C Gram-positive bacteria)]OZE89292.1 hypothetical protein CH302_28340 [Rhodococcus sp. 15-2388-1-1a]
MTNLEQRIHDLPPDRFARSAHAAAKLAVRSAKRAGKEPPASALWLLKQSPEQLQAQQQKRLQEESAAREHTEPVDDVAAFVGALTRRCSAVGEREGLLPDGETLRAAENLVAAHTALAHLGGDALVSYPGGKTILISAEDGEMRPNTKKTWKVSGFAGLVGDGDAHKPEGTLQKSPGSEGQRR